MTDPSAAPRQPRSAGRAGLGWSHQRLHAAQAAAERGWAVFPVLPYTKIPAVRDWENQATTSQEQIGAWWAIGRAYNVGIACGPAGLLVIDLDTGRGQPPPARWSALGVASGADVFAILAARAKRPLPDDTYTVQTPSGGAHIYYRAPEGTSLRNTAGALGWRVDSRATGGYVLAAGSALRVDGRITAYQVVRDVPAVPLPAWLHLALAPTPADRRAHYEAPTVPARADAYVRAAVTGESVAVASASVGQRNITLFRAAANLGQLVGSGLLEETAATRALESAATVHIGVQGFTSAEAAHTIANGLARGRRQPRGHRATRN